MQRRSVGSDGAQRLGVIPLFEGLSPGQLSMLGRLLDEIVADPGDVLMAEGSQGFEMMMIEEGSAEVCQHGERINVMQRGDFFGEMAVLADGSPRTASVIALTPLRGLLFTARFARTMHDRVPQVGERMERAARERLERDARAGASPD
ncbi:MAG: cyclic nucleotide-binding domain-containing protein [Solirubrobacteraceae bacterium]